MFPASKTSLPLHEAPAPPAMTLSETERGVYDLIDREEVSIDEIIRKSGMAPSAVSVALLGLEMKRLIRQLPGKLFVRNI